MLRELTEKLNDGQDLSESHAADALEEMLSEDCQDADIAAFLVALAEKGETAAELVGFARVMRSRSLRIQSKHAVFIDTAGTGGGGETFNISTAAALVIAAAGLPVAKHGNRAITSRCGSADVLAELGLPLDRSPRTAEHALNEIGICFMFAPSFHPAMKRLAAIRRELGRRTIFNLLGPLTNPAGAPFQIIGVFSDEVVERVAEALRLLGVRRGWVVHSRDGLDELSVSAPTKVAEVTAEGVREFDFTPLEIGIGIPKGGSPAENAQLIRGILEGTVSGPARQIVVLNAAAALHVALEVPFSRGLEMAEGTIISGTAREKLDRLVALYSR